MRVRLILLAAFFFLSLNIHAKLRAYESWAVVSEDKSRILVMLPRNPEGDEEFDLGNGRIINLPKTFSSSGVYDLKTLEPIWTFDWYEPWLVYYRKDFSSIIRVNDYALIKAYSINKTQYALKFIYNGQEVKTYLADDLLTAFDSRLFLPFETGGYYIRWFSNDVWFNNELASNEKYTFTTTKRALRILGFAIPLGYSETYIFELKTGKIIDKKINCTGFVLMLLSPFVFVGIILWFWYIKKRHREG